MAHLLMIENWFDGSGWILPRAIGELDHRFTLVTRDLHEYLRRPPPDGSHPLLDAHNVLTCETNDLPALLDFVARQHQILGFDGVLTGCDYYLSATAHAAARLGLPGPPPDAMDRAHFKHEMRLALDRAGIPNPAFRVTDSWDGTRAAAAELGYPLVFKPVDLGSGRHVTLVGEEAELRRSFEALEAFSVNNREQPRPRLFLLEEYMVGDEVSVEAYAFEGETHVIGITDKSVAGAPYFVESGHMFPAALELEVADAACDLVRRALAAVGYTHGLSHTEVKLTPEGPRIVEINPRAGGNSISRLVRLVTGIDPLKVLVQLALGQRPSDRPADTGIRSAAIQFVLAPRAGRVAAVGGSEAFADDEDMIEWALDPLVGKEIGLPRGNDYLGYVIAADRAGLGARARAERAVGQIHFQFDRPAAG